MLGLSEPTKSNAIQYKMNVCVCKKEANYTTSSRLKRSDYFH